MLLDSPAEKQRDTRGYESERQQHRGGQRQYHGDRHGVEHFSFDARQREDRQVHGRDDADAKQTRPDDFGAGPRRKFEALLAMQDAAQARLFFAEAAQRVLHDDHGAVHDESEVERTEAHEISGHAAAHHSRDGHQHRERNDGGGDQCRPEIAEQQEQHGDDQQRAFDQAGAHRCNGSVDQAGAVIHGLDGNALGQALLDFRHFRRRSTRDRTTVFANEHEDGAEHHLLATLSCSTGAQLTAFGHRCDVANPDGYAITSIEHDRLERPEVRSLIRNANQELLAAPLDIAGADILIVLGECPDHVIQGEPVRQQASRIRCDVNLPHVAANGADFGDARGGAQLRTHHPIVNRAQIHRGPRLAIGPRGARVSRDRVKENLSQAGCDRPEFRGKVRRKLRLDLGDALSDLLAREVDVGAVLEDHRHLRKPVA